MELEDRIRSVSEDYLERPLKKADGTPLAELKRAEKRLGITLPPAL